LASISTVIAAVNNSTPTASSLRWGFAPAGVAIVLALVVSFRHLPDRTTDDADLPPRWRRPAKGLQAPAESHTLAETA
jgi:hypothetical protein